MWRSRSCYSVSFEFTSSTVGCRARKTTNAVRDNVRCLNWFLFASGQVRAMATISKIKVENPVVDLDGDEMTRYVMTWAKYGLIWHAHTTQLWMLLMLVPFVFTAPASFSIYCECFLAAGHYITLHSDLLATPLLDLWFLAVLLMQTLIQITSA